MAGFSYVDATNLDFSFYDSGGFTASLSRKLKLHPPVNSAGTKINSATRWTWRCPKSVVIPTLEKLAEHPSTGTAEDDDTIDRAWMIIRQTFNVGSQLCLV